MRAALSARAAMSARAVPLAFLLRDRHRCPDAREHSLLLRCFRYRVSAHASLLDRYESLLRQYADALGVPFRAEPRA